MSKGIVYNAHRKVKAFLQRQLSVRAMSDASDRHVSLQASFDNALGDYLTGLESDYLALLLKEYRGKRVIHLSVFDACTAKPSSPFQIVHRVYSSEKALVCDRACIARFDSLPFDSVSADVVILQHVLEYSINPQQVLKEAARITDNGGHVIIIGFSPVSSHGLWSLLWGRFKPESFWLRRSLLAYRVNDWLKFLDFSALQSQQLCHSLPITHGAYLGVMARLSRFLQRANIPFSPVYCLVSRKDVVGLNKPRSDWTTRVIGRALAVPKPAQQAGSVVHFSPQKTDKTH